MRSQETKQPRELESPAANSGRPAKRAKLIQDESESSDESSDNDGGVPILKVNEEYARRFEHNKKREEMHRCK
jgi:protein KRI1